MIKELYQSILNAMIRFWDNRFIEREDPTLRLLELELERERFEKKRLLDLLAEMVSPKPIVEDKNDEEFKPIHQPKHWRVRAKELEAESREKRRILDFEKTAPAVDIDKLKAVSSTEELERVLGVD